AEATRSPDSLTPLIERARVRVGVSRSFQVVVSAAATTPQLLGLKRPVIALPPDFFDRLDSEEQEIALLHELVHLKRCDLIIMAVTEAAISLQWFNPLSQRVRKAVRDDQEAACDETVRSLGVCRQRYASLLVKAASRASRVPALTLEHGLKDRILLMTSPVSPRLVRRVAALTAIAGAASIAAATASYADVDIMLLADETADVDLERGNATATGQRRQVGLVEPKSTSAFYWDHYRSDARDNDLYTLHRDGLHQTPARPPMPRSPVSALKEQWAD
ncbi:MAG: M56 family metallopeptidase, partial [Pseudomonadota bacterium]